MIAFFGNTWQEGHLIPLSNLFSNLREEKIRFCVNSEFASFLVDNGIGLDAGESVREIPEGTSLLISVGGDGTFLRAATWLHGRRIPVLGINTGHLGYLAGFSLERAEEVLAAIRGKMEISSRMTLKAESDALPAECYPFALNEISVSKGDTTSMVNIRVWVDGNYLADYLADGLVVATPTGSTAYNLSCGGAILQPTMDSVILTPIAPHSLTLRPLVVDARSVLKLEITSRGEQSHVAIDGRTFAVANGTIMTIRKASHRVEVAQPCNTDFAQTLRRKLMWGAR